MDGYVEIDNQSSQDLHVSFYPNKFSKSNTINYSYPDITVKESEITSFIIKCRDIGQENHFHLHAYYGPFPNYDIREIIISKMGSNELIKVVKNYRNNLFTNFSRLTITDELLSTEGDEE